MAVLSAALAFAITMLILSMATNLPDKVVGLEDPIATDRALPNPNPGCDDSELADLSKVYSAYTDADIDIFPQSIDRKSSHHSAFELPERPTVNSNHPS